MIDKLAYVHPDAKIGNNVKIMPFAFVGEDTEIGDDCIIMPYSAVLPGTTLGKGNRIHGHTLLGVDPQDFNYKGAKSRLIIGDGNDIRENVVIARGLDEKTATKIGNANHIMEKVHICHDADIHNRTVLGISAIIAANTLIESEAILTNQVVIMNDCRIGRRSLILSGCRVQKDVPPYIVTNENPVEYHGVNTVILRHFNTSDRILRHIANAYRIIFHGDTSLQDAIMKVEEQIPPSEEINNIVKFIKGSKLGIIQCKY
jgi:UDP-N-acetylglucosamine acyltransferase